MAGASDSQLLEALHEEAGGGDITNNEVVRLTARALDLPDEPTDASIVGGLRQIPGTIARIGRAAFEGPPGPLRFAAEVMADVGRAAQGDQDAADRVAATNLVEAAGSVAIPGGPLGSGAAAAATRAAIGGATAAATAGLTSEGDLGEIGRQAATGAAIGAALPPAARYIAREFKPLMTPVAKFLSRMHPDDAGRVARGAIAGDAPASTPVTRLTAALKEAKPIRNRQELLVTAERAKRFQRFEEIGTQVSGEEGARSQLTALSGELPALRTDFESLRKALSQGDVNELFDLIKMNPALKSGEKTTGFRALWKLLGHEGGVVPQKGEIEILQSAFGPELVDALLAKQPLLTRMRQLGVDLLNVPRAINASFDLSAPLRQGAFLAGRPKQFLPAFARMFKLIGSDDALQALNKELTSGPYAQMMRPIEQAGVPGLAITDTGGVLGRREEAFLGNLAEKIPVIGGGIRASERAYVGFLNKLRVDTFNDIMTQASRAGQDVSNPLFLRSLHNFINSATGRGHMPRALERVAPELSTILFSPRLIAARLNIMQQAVSELPGIRHGLEKVGYEAMHPTVRKEFFKTMASTGALAASTLGLLAAAGARVETDPRSSDFGKGRIGNTRFDLFAGFQQYVRLGMQIAPNFGIDELPTAGVKGTRSSTIQRYGRGFNAPTRLKQVSDFMENKLAPVPALMLTLLRGKERFRDRPTLGTIESLASDRPLPPESNKLNAKEKAFSTLSPIIISDVVEAMAEWGPETGAFMATPAVFGVGVSSYPSPAADPSPRPESLLARVFEKRRRDAEQK